MATNYTPLLNKATNTLTAALLNAPLQELDDAIEDAGDGTDALPSPSIVDFTNSQHDHADAAGGGLIEGADLAFTGADDTDVVTADGANGVAMGSPLILPTTFRQGLPISRLSDTQALVGVGSVMVGSVMVNKSTQTVLDMYAGADWLTGNATPFSGSKHSLYINNDGDIRFHDAVPNASAPSDVNLICQAWVNQAGWDGTDTNGLNELSVVIDNGGGGDPVGAANIAAGMLLGVYTDTGRSVGRGKGQVSWGARAFASFVRITAIDTDTNTLTLKADHAIAMNDNDVLAVIEDGMVIYRYEGGEWWRWLGMINRGASVVEALYADQYNYVFNEAADVTTTSTTFALMAGGGTLFTQGGDVLVHIHGVLSNSGATGYDWIGASIDGLAPVATPNQGYFLHLNPDVATPDRPQRFSFTRLFTDLAPGTHWINVLFNTNNGANTARFHVQDEHPQIWCKEVPRGGGY